MEFFCKYCGAKIDEATVFCPKCGERVDGTAPKTEKESGAREGGDKREKAERKEKKGGFFRSFITFLVTFLFVGGAGWGIITYVLPMFASFTLAEFQADEVYFVCGEDAQITFTVKASAKAKKLQLVKEENQVMGTMHDDGKNGDETANDGIYTLVVTDEVESDAIVLHTYHCRQFKNKSESVKVYYFPQPTEESAVEARDALEYIRREIKAIENEYHDVSGYVPVDQRKDVIDAVIEEMDTWIDEGIVLCYEAEDDSLYIKMTSGIGSIYSPSIPNTDAIGSDVSMSVITCQPQFTEMGGTTFTASNYELPAGISYVLEMPDAAAEGIADNFENYTFSSVNNYDDSQVTLEVINNFGKNQIVLWHGHGYYGPIVKSALVTGEEFDWVKFWWDIPYYMNCVTNRFVNCLEFPFEQVIITSKYIDHYCGKMDNSFFYLAACSSGKDPKLANAFLKKGASAVVGNDETIFREYNVLMMYQTVMNMLSVNRTTNNYYTLSEALEKAKDVYGEDDSSYGTGKSVAATPVIFGGQTANNYRFGDALGTLAGKVCQAADRMTPIPSAKVSVYKNNKLQETIYTDEDGNYSVEILAGDYYVEITAEGFIGFNSYAVVQAKMNTYMETFLMILESEDKAGYAGGTVYHSITKTGVPDVKISFIKDWNNSNTASGVETSVLTDEYGEYYVELPLGNYTAVCEKDGFVTCTFNMIVQEGETVNQNGTITPVVSGRDYLITLTWDEYPEDLDAHVEGYMSNGEYFHVDYHYSENRDYSPNYTPESPILDGDVYICRLDCDDIESYGPEHITLSTTTDLPYYFYVHHYGGSGSLSSSGANITIHQGNALIAEFNVPSDYWDEAYWNVFAIKNGEIIFNNTLSDYPDVEYAG